MWAGILLSTYDCIRDAAGCLIPSGRIPNVFRCLEARNGRRDGALRILLEVALDVSTRSSVGVAAGGR